MVPRPLVRTGSLGGGAGPMKSSRGSDSLAPSSRAFAFVGFAFSFRSSRRRSERLVSECLCREVDRSRWRLSLRDGDLERLRSSLSSRLCRFRLCESCSPDLCLSRPPSRSRRLSRSLPRSRLLDLCLESSLDPRPPSPVDDSSPPRFLFPRIALILPICLFRISPGRAFLLPSALSNLSSLACDSAASLASSAALCVLVSLMTLRRKRVLGFGRFAGLWGAQSG